MPRKAPLRAVRESDTPKQAAEPKTLADAADLSERALLVAMRARLAREIDGGVPPHTLAPLTRQMREIDKEIRLLDSRAEIEGREGGTVDDEVWDAEAL